MKRGNIRRAAFLLVFLIIFRSLTPTLAASAGPLEVPFLKQYIEQLEKDKWGKNCGQTCCVMAEAYFKGISPTTERIIELNNAFPPNDYVNDPSYNGYIGKSTGINSWPEMLEWMGLRYQSDGNGTLEKIKSHIDEGHPVIGLFDGRYTSTNTNGYQLSIKNGEKSHHAMLVVGYDDAKQILIVSDPGSGGNSYRTFKYDVINNTLWSLRDMTAVLGLSGTSAPTLPPPPTPTPEHTTFSYSLKNETYPSGTLILGNNFGVQGKITSTHTISSLTAKVIRKADQVTVITKTIYPNAKTASIFGSLSNAMTFESLPLGQYMYQVIIDVSGPGICAEVIRSDFTIARTNDSAEESVTTNNTEIIGDWYRTRYDLSNDRTVYIKLSVYESSDWGYLEMNGSDGFNVEYDVLLKRIGIKDSDVILGKPKLNAPHGQQEYWYETVDGKLIIWDNYSRSVYTRDKEPSR